MKCIIDDFEYTIEEQDNGKLVYLNDIRNRKSYFTKI